MFYFMHVFLRAKFEMVIFHLQSKKISLENVKMSKNDNFQSSSSILARLEINWRNILQMLYFMHVFYWEKFKMLCFIFSSINVLKNAKWSKNDNFWSFSSTFWGLETIWGNLKNHPILDRCYPMHVFSWAKFESSILGDLKIIWGNITISPNV